MESGVPRFLPLAKDPEPVSGMRDSRNWKATVVILSRSCLHCGRPFKFATTQDPEGYPLRFLRTRGGGTLHTRCANSIGVSYECDNVDVCGGVKGFQNLHFSTELPIEALACQIVYDPGIYPYRRDPIASMIQPVNEAIFSRSVLGVESPGASEAWMFAPTTQAWLEAAREPRSSSRTEANAAWWQASHRAWWSGKNYGQRSVKDFYKL